MTDKDTSGNARDLRSVAKNSPVTMWRIGRKEVLLHMLCYDCSKGGIGCIYVGDEPPLPGNSLIWQEEGGQTLLQVRWMKTVSERIYRFGLQYIQAD